MHSRHSLVLCLCLLPCVLVPAQAAASEDSRASQYVMYELVTCAVYFRMVVGSMSPRYGRDLGALLETERDKMNKLMALARVRAAAEYGEDMAEEMFQSEWRAILGEMTDQINRSYENISRLRTRYDARCEKMAAAGESG